MKLIDHVTKKEIGEMDFSSFRVDDVFMIPLNNEEKKYYLVTGVDYSGEGRLYLFELTKDQYQKGLRIKDVLV